VLAGNVYAFASQGIASGTALLVTLLLARYLGLQGFGAFSMVWLLGQLALQLQQCLLLAPMLSLLPSMQGKQAHDFEVGLFTWGHSMAALLGLLAFALCSLPTLQPYAPWLPQAKGGTGLYITLLLLHHLVRKRAFAHGRPARALCQDAATHAVQLAALAVAMGTGRLTLNTVWWCFSAGYAAGLLLVRLKYGPIFWAPQYSRAVLARLWQYARWLLAAQALQWWAGNYYLVVAAAALGTAALGALRVCQTIMGVLHVLLLALENIVPVRAAALLHREGQQAFARYIWRTLARAVAMAAAFVGIVALGGSGLLHALAGHNPEVSSGLLLCLAAMYVLVAAGTVIRFALRTKALNAPTFWGYALSAALAWALAWPLTNQWGAYGTVAGLWASQLTMLVVLLPPFVRAMATGNHPMGTQPLGCNHH